MGTSRITNPLNFLLYFLDHPVNKPTAMKSRQTEARTGTTLSRGSLSPARTDGSLSPGRLRTWDPLVGEDEKAKRKALREEALNSSPLTKQQDPVLLIRQKEVITKILPGDALTDQAREDAPKFIKKTTNPRHVNIDYSEAKLQAKEQNDPRKIKTKITDQKPKFKISDKDEITEEKITKITGTEFLPRGYVELEPMLLLDEFEFVSHYYEQDFIEDQRKTKELRRKQYGQRNMNRVRDFVIYRIEYIKSEAAKILRKWFDAKDHPMPHDTICQFADMLGLESHTFQKLHDVYMKERNVRGGDYSKNLNEAIFNDPNQEELRNQEVADADSRSSSHGRVPIDPARRAEVLAEQKRARQEEARRRQQSSAQSTAQQSALANSLLQAQAEADASRQKIEKLTEQQMAQRLQMEKLAHEKKMREQDMLRARREHSKEREAKSKLTDAYKEAKRKAMDAEHELLDLKARTSDCMEDRQRLQKLLEEDKAAHERALKEALANCRREADRSKRDGIIEAQVESQRTKAENDELKAQLDAAYRRIAELEAELQKLQRAFSRSRERRRKEMEKERAAEKELEAQRQAMLASQRALKQQEQNRRDENDRILQEAELLKREASKLQDEERRREDAKRLDEIKKETDKLRREREKLEKERERLAEDDRLRQEKRRQEDLEKKRLAEERERRRKAKEDERRKQEAQQIKFSEDKKATRPFPPGMSRMEDVAEEQEIEIEEESDNDSRDAITLATLDYDVRNMSGQKPNDSQADDYRQMIEDLIASMKIPHGLTYEDIWAMFIEYCQQDLPSEIAHQKKIMAITFQRFLTKRFSKAKQPRQAGQSNIRPSPRKGGVTNR